MGHLWWLHSNHRALVPNNSRMVNSEEKYLLVLGRRDIMEVKNDQTGQDYIFKKVSWVF